MTTAVVTGTSGGIGAAVASRLAADGHRVVGVDVRQPGADPGHEHRHCDLTDAAATAQVLGEIRDAHPVGILVNVAGWTSVSRFLDEDEPYWRDLVEVNLLAVLRTCHLLVPAMCTAGWGRVVNIGSAAGQAGAAATAVYAATKGGVHAFTKSLAQEVARSGVTVNAVAPGTIDTPLSTQDRDYTAKLARRIPRGRLGVPDDVAAAVSFLCSEQADYITGQVLGVNGGLVMTG